MAQATAIGRITKRADFLAAAKGRRVSTRHFRIQARKRDVGETPRVGYTATKKTGTAVVRNRIRRRFRELIRLYAGPYVKPDHDYVLIANPGADTASFDALKADLGFALNKLHNTRSAKA